MQHLAQILDIGDPIRHALHLVLVRRHVGRRVLPDGFAARRHPIGLTLHGRGARLQGSVLARTRNADGLLQASVVLALSGLTLFWLAPIPLLTITGLFLAGAGIANMFPLSLTMALSTAPLQTNLASARTSLSGSLALLTAPLLLGWLADHFGIQAAFGGVAVGLVLMLLLILLARSSHQRIPDGAKYREIT